MLERYVHGLARALRRAPAQQPAPRDPRELPLVLRAMMISRWRSDHGFDEGLGGGELPPR